LSGVFAVDGKSLCGAYGRGKSALPVHLVNVFAAKARLPVSPRSPKSPRGCGPAKNDQWLKRYKNVHFQLLMDLRFCPY
jgi:hypothetical protein